MEGHTSDTQLSYFALGEEWKWGVQMAAID